MNYKEILDVMRELRDKARANDRYFKDEDHEWLIGADVFRVIRDELEQYGISYAKDYDDIKIMGIPATRDYAHRTRIDLVRDTKKEHPKAIYISTASRTNSMLKEQLRILENSRYGKYGGYTYFKPQFEMDVNSLYPSDITEYLINDAKFVRELYEIEHERRRKERMVPEIDRVIYNNPATIVFWKDGTKTVVKAQDEAFDEEKGLAMAIAKKVYGNDGKYFNKLKKHLPKIEKKPVKKPKARKKSNKK